jgi:5-oxoprolinase (ATP-hydrolysing) subunit A
MTGRIDLNSDLGESFGRWVLGDDEAMLGVVTSANVACGFHAGDATTLRRTCALAAAAGVTIGAQVSYRDLAGFGRRFVDMDPGELADDVVYQLGALEGLCRVAGTSVRYVKPHGALYNTAADDPVQAGAIAAAVAAVDPALPLLGLPGSELERAARAAGLPYVAEGFADRAYLATGRLVPRGQPGAVHADRMATVAQAVQLARFGTVTAVDGTRIEVPVESVCVHGDTPGAVHLVREIRRTLADAGIEPAPFRP